ncbi:fluoride efflux transporter FluC [Actinomyces minihominis]|uniref:fluoride efflux transporter FluC n=1 Tax=Actinomyces minihominis TaxID=2002838 RepID=UPI0013ED1F60|nr:CrcB family protein [Actinomyces minihominis]
MKAKSRYVGVVLVFAGGAVGALLRYLIDLLAGSESVFDWDIFLINLSGAFLLALLVGWVTGAGSPTIGQQRLRLLLGTGMMGGFTTYSTLALDTATNLQQGLSGSAVVYSLGTVVVGAGLSLVGLLVGRRLARTGSAAGKVAP